MVRDCVEMWGWWSSSGGEKEDEGGENESGDNDAHDSSQGRDLRASLVEGFGGEMLKV